MLSVLGTRTFSNSQIKKYGVLINEDLYTVQYNENPYVKCH